MRPLWKAPSQFFQFDFTRIHGPRHACARIDHARASRYRPRDIEQEENEMADAELEPVLRQIADALDRMAPPEAPDVDWSAADAFIWHGEDEWLQPIESVSRVDLDLLQGIERVRDILRANTKRFADDLPANNALLWGARGMGKSSLVKAIHAAINLGRTEPLVLVEIHREEINTLPALLGHLRPVRRRFLIFCDDLSFDSDDTSYKSLKAVLDGGVEGRPGNVLFYATSNRRHLMARDMIENEQGSAINPGEAVEEKVSLSDRFGLWLGFHACNQPTYLAMIDAYADHFKLGLDRTSLHEEAKEWSVTRGARSGRVAWQFITDLAGRMGQSLD